VAFDFETVVPWGRSLQEYVAMFDLSPEELESRILDCGGGPAGFNVEMTRRGGRVTSVDPLYRHTAEAISRRIDETYPGMIESMEAEKPRFVWEHLRSPRQAGETRMAAMRLFLEDFETGRAEGRYIAAELPRLPFGSGEFDLALCSHLLFLYSTQLSLEMHLQSIREMLRVAHEVRIFPLLDLNGRRSMHVDPVLADLARQGLRPRIREVGYEFQRGGNQMMMVTNNERVCSSE
jgi:ubiquinone/menaquinone biosynthesis C-methylase UbiE